MIDQMLREGKEFRERGDTTNALARFQEALDSEPNNAAVLAELLAVIGGDHEQDRSLKRGQPRDQALEAAIDLAEEEAAR